MRHEIKRNRIICTVLAALLTSCGGTAAAETPDTAKSSVEKNDITAETEPETEAQYLASLPDADYEGKDYVILCRTEKSHELWADAENGEPGSEGEGRARQRFRRNAGYHPGFPVF